MQERGKAGKAEIRYGQGSVHGVKAVDKVCMTGTIFNPANGGGGGLASGEEQLCVSE